MGWIVYWWLPAFFMGLILFGGLVYGLAGGLIGRKASGRK